MTTKADNVRSKQLLLNCLDHGILSAMAEGYGIEVAGGVVIVEAEPPFIAALITNRNRVARLFDLPTTRKEDYGRPDEENED